MFITILLHAGLKETEKRFFSVFKIVPLPFTWENQ